MHDFTPRVEFLAPVITAYTNTTGADVYLFGCRTPSRPTLQKRVDGAWVDAWMPVEDGCLSPPWRIRPGETYRDTLHVVGYKPGYNTAPTFDTAIEGTYRLVRAIYDVPELDAQGSGLLPLAQRVSNAFEVTEREIDYGPLFGTTWQLRRMGDRAFEGDAIVVGFEVWTAVMASPDGTGTRPGWFLDLQLFCRRAGGAYDADVDGPAIDVELHFQGAASCGASEDEAARAFLAHLKAVDRYEIEGDRLTLRREGEPGGTLVFERQAEPEDG